MVYVTNNRGRLDCGDNCLVCGDNIPKNNRGEYDLSTNNYLFRIANRDTFQGILKFILEDRASGAFFGDVLSDLTSYYLDIHNMYAIHSKCIESDLKRCDKENSWIFHNGNENDFLVLRGEIAYSYHDFFERFNRITDLIEETRSFYNYSYIQKRVEKIIMGEEKIIVDVIHFSEARIAKEFLQQRYYDDKTFDEEIDDSIFIAWERGDMEAVKKYYQKIL